MENRIVNFEDSLSFTLVLNVQNFLKRFFFSELSELLFYLGISLTETPIRIFETRLLILCSRT